MKTLIKLFMCLFPFILNAGVLTLTDENDIFGKANRDREYTNGFRIDYLTSSVPSLFGLKNLSENVLINGKETFGLGLSQSMYTPDVIETPFPDPLDRPYTGVLFAEIAYASYTDLKYTRLGYQIGTVGPNAFCEETQTWIHESRDNAIPLGWYTQEVNEPMFNLSYSYREKLFHSSTMDIIPNASFAVGNAFVFSTIGVESRLGYNIPNDFGRIIQEPVPRDMDNFSMYGIIGGYGKAVGYDIALDGSMFEDTKSVEKEPFVAEYYYGIGIDKQYYSLRYIISVRTKEFKGQDQNMEFGTVSLIFGKKI